MKKRYKPMFAHDSEDLLEIAKNLDVKCGELTDERDKLLKVICKANEVIDKFSSLRCTTSVKISNEIVQIDKKVQEYYKLIQEILNENISKKNKTPKR